jgi:hypothetical protein
MTRRKPQQLSKPYPATAEIPDAGLTLFGANWGRSYALARANVIVTITAGKRRKLALMHATCARLGINPND